jgi:hypothetical protein
MAYKQKGFPLHFGVSPMKQETEPEAQHQEDGMKYKTMDFRTWKNEVYNKENSYGQGLEMPDSYAKPDYEEYLALENERAGFNTDKKGRATTEE